MLNNILVCPKKTFFAFTIKKGKSMFSMSPTKLFRGVLFKQQSALSQNGQLWHKLSGIMYSGSAKKQKQQRQISVYKTFNSYVFYTVKIAKPLQSTLFF